MVPQPGDNVVKYVVRIKRTVAYERLVLLCVGLTLFFAAPRMARWVRERGRDFVSSLSISILQECDSFLWSWDQYRYRGVSAYPSLHVWQVCTKG